MLQRRLATTVLVGAVCGSASPSFADAPIWENWQPVFTPAPYTQAYQQPRGEFAPARPGSFQPQFQLAAYTQPVRPDPIQRGLLDLSRSLEGKSLWQRNATQGANLSNKTLMDTVQALLGWREALLPAVLERHFDLLPVDSAKAFQKGDFTGYYTPILQGSRFPTAQFNVPVYRMPKGNTSRLSNAEISQGALRGKGLEVAWVDDPYLLYIAQVQGSAEIHFTDGSISTLDYAGSNDLPFRSVSRYLKDNGYKVGSFTHENIGNWLHERPAILREALWQNPRYIFFRETKGLPTTASGNPVIPGHTIAVDSRYIPHGSVLLAELPRVNMQGERMGGTEWRLLFAQDHGRAIQGDGRFDLYTGVGDRAASAAYAVSGLHKAFLLVRKAG